MLRVCNCSQVSIKLDLRNGRCDETQQGPTALKLRYDLISLSPALTLIPF